ncbi:helicase associated domain-containing protein [Streptomyces sp. CL12-4]|uniref:helicase associated domain-containing protein n=1 Tax=Streptomyces sp. CL12-4 TaxID=2810306 RepID=UPI001EFAA484|nr:helicase associated domain-containing protein [Streptomyces sp. CL12-4]
MAGSPPGGLNVRSSGSFDSRGPGVSRSRRLGLAAAQAYRDHYGHLDVPADYTDPTGYKLGTFLTTMRDAAKTGRLATDWIAELDTLGMTWDKHDAAWRSRLTAAADYLRVHGHLAAPATTPVGAWLAEQRHHAAKNTSTPPSPASPRTGASRTARTGTANTTCSAPASPPAPTPPRSPATPSWPA